MKVWQYLVTGFVLGLVTLSHPGQLAAEDASPGQEGASAAGKQEAHKLETTRQASLDYLLYLPKDYAKQESWPLMLFLHGAGERGDNLDRVKVHGPPKLIAAGQQLPFIVVSPQCPRDKRWEPFALAALLDAIVQEYKVDEERIYVTGLSMGGYGTWALAAYQPERFAAIAPICGGGEPIVAKLFRPVPAWVFHGAKDTVVPIQRSEVMVEAMKNAKGEVKFTIYPEAGHDSWTESYANPELFEWLLQHRRADR